MATTKSTGFKLSVMTLAIMNITAVVSLRGLPSEAVYGPSSAFYYLFAAIVFLIPTALVAAELAAMFADKQGGVFRWVGEAMGARTGFLAIWLQWIESTIWYPTVLTFGAVSIAFIGMNDVHDAVDQLGVQAAFCALLMRRELEALRQGDDVAADQWCEVREHFMAQHLGRWAHDYAADMRQFALTDFYRGVADLIDEAV